MAKMIVTEKLLAEFPARPLSFDEVFELSQQISLKNRLTPNQKKFLNQLLARIEAFPPEQRKKQPAALAARIPFGRPSMVEIG